MIEIICGFFILLAFFILCIGYGTMIKYGNEKGDEFINQFVPAVTSISISLTFIAVAIKFCFG